MFHNLVCLKLDVQGKTVSSYDKILKDFSKLDIESVIVLDECVLKMQYIIDRLSLSFAKLNTWFFFVSQLKLHLNNANTVSKIT